MDEMDVWIRVNRWLFQKKKKKKKKRVGRPIRQMYACVRLRAEYSRTYCSACT